MRCPGQGGPGGGRPRWIRAACLTVRSATSTTQRRKWPCGLVATGTPHGAYRASDTAALTARIGEFRFTSGWSLTRTAENRAQLMSDAPLTTCG